MAILLIYNTRSQKEAATSPSSVLHDQLTTTSYVIMGVVTLLFMVGLGWCFYRALSAAAGDSEVQGPDEMPEQ
jgi:hypothetical protein